MRTCKEFLKTPIYKMAQRHDCAILIASMGRSGSTLLAKAARQALLDNKGCVLGYDFSKHLHKDAWDLKETHFQKGRLYKTHSSKPPCEIPDFVKVIYTYTHPLDAITAIEIERDQFGDVGVKNHFEHLGAEYQPIENAYQADILKYEENFLSWVNGDHSYPFLAVRYESFWEYEAKIAEFLGVPLKLPEYRERKSKKIKHSDEKRAAIDKTYKNLIQTMDDMPALFISSK